MAILTQGTPGVAMAGSEVVLSADEPRFGDGAAQTTICNVGAEVELPIYSVISYDGTTIALAEMAGDPAASNAYGILAAPVLTGVGGATTVPVYRTGHFEMGALNWDDSFDTDAKKAAAFEGGKSPTIFVSKAAFDSANINI